MYRRVKEDEALIRFGLGGDRVFLTGGFVWPVIHHAEVIKLEQRVLDFSFTKAKSVHCKDNLRTDLAFTLRLGLKRDEEALLTAWRENGKQLNDTQALRRRYDAMLTEQVKSMVKQHEYALLVERQEAVVDALSKGLLIDAYFVLDGLEMAPPKQTAREYYDPDNILDATGLMKLTEEITRREIKENEERRERQKQEALRKAMEQQQQ